MTRLKAERLARGWSQITLAYKARVANSDVSKWERRMAAPYPSQATRLAKVLGIPPDRLLDAVEQHTGDQKVSA